MDRDIYSDSDVNTSAMCVHELLEQHQKLRGKYKVSELLHFYCYLFKSSKHLVDTNRGIASMKKLQTHDTETWPDVSR